MDPRSGCLRLTHNPVPSPCAAKIGDAEDIGKVVVVIVRTLLSEGMEFVRVGVRVQRRLR
jgi:hypothetical protein